MRPNARVQDLVLEASGTDLVIHDEQHARMHRLNATLAAVWRHCDGHTRPATIAEHIAEELGVPADEDLVLSSLDELDRLQLLDPPLKRAPLAQTLSRRNMFALGLTGLAAALLPSCESTSEPPTPNRITEPLAPKSPLTSDGVVGQGNARNECLSQCAKNQRADLDACSATRTACKNAAKAAAEACTAAAKAADAARQAAIDAAYQACLAAAGDDRRKKDACRITRDADRRKSAATLAADLQKCQADRIAAENACQVTYNQCAAQAAADYQSCIRACPAQ